MAGLAALLNCKSLPLRGRQVRVYGISSLGVNSCGRPVDTGGNIPWGLLAPTFIGGRRDHVDPFL
jgi:hypothetical protein